MSHAQTRLAVLDAEIAALSREAELLRASESEAVAAHSCEAALAAGAALAASRAYARSVHDHSHAEVAEGCARSLREYGFAVIDHVVPHDRVGAVRDEVEHATGAIATNTRTRELVREGRGLTAQNDPCNAVLFVPQLAEYLAHPAVTGTARDVLDEHIRLAQFNTRPLPADKPDGSPWEVRPEDAHHVGYPAGVAAELRGPLRREYHTDWPHNVAASGRQPDAFGAQKGSIKKEEGRPFPDICMCLSAVWLLTDTDPTSGAPWVVPYSHRDSRNPFGPRDGVTRSAAIPGEIQITAPAGSVYLQDSRTWHSSALHNSSGRDRVAMVCRYAPWWLSVQEFDGIQVGFLSRSDWDALPPALQPLLRHACTDLLDGMQREKVEACASWAGPGMEKDRDDDANAAVFMPGALLPRL